MLLAGVVGRVVGQGCEERRVVSWVIASPQRKRLLKRIRVEVDFRSQPFGDICH